MKKKTFFFAAGIILLILFAIFTFLLTKIDVQIPAEGKIGEVGFYSLNNAFASATGVSEGMYKLSEILGCIFILFACFTVFLGIYYWIRNGSLKKVPGEIFVTGGLYAAVVAVYALFEVISVNNRPILIDGAAEASYPSSHTLLAICIFGSSLAVIRLIVKNIKIRKLLYCLSTVLTVMLVLSRLLSGYHWLTDVLGCILLSSGIVFIYFGFIEIVREKGEKKNGS